MYKNHCHLSILLTIKLSGSLFFQIFSFLNRPGKVNRGSILFNLFPKLWAKILLQSISDYNFSVWLKLFNLCQKEQRKSIRNVTSIFFTSNRCRIIASLPKQFQSLFVTHQNTDVTNKQLSSSRSNAWTVQFLTRTITTQHQHLFYIPKKYIYRQF